jgi:hypothetical protein
MRELQRYWTYGLRDSDDPLIHIGTVLKPK